MLRCRDVECGDLGLTWPDKLRQLGSDCPSFEEVDSAVKRLETQRLNLNCLGNGCNMKPMETLQNPRGKTGKCMRKCIIGPVIAMEMQWNLQCGIMWNQYEPQQEYVLLRGLSAICGTTCPMHFQLRLHALALRCSKAKRARNRVQRKRQKKTCDTSEKPFATASLESLFDVFPVFVPLTIVACTWIILWGVQGRALLIFSTNGPTK